MYWMDSLVEEIENKIEQGQREPPIRLNVSLSVPGLHHVGLMRGAILNHSLHKSLEKDGIPTTQSLLIRSREPWKGLPPQLEQFESPQKAQKYAHRPLTQVPDPKGNCHTNWLEHFQDPFHSYLTKFVDDVKVISTAQLYKNEMKPLIRTVFDKKEDLQQVLSKHGTGEVASEDLILFHPICEECGKLGNVNEVTIVPDEYEVAYECKCGNEGKISTEDGKLPWNVERAALWKLLDIDFEPYRNGQNAEKNREIAETISSDIFEYPAPITQTYGGVSSFTKENKEKLMSSTEFHGFTPKEWFEVADPTIFRFLCLIRGPQRRVSAALEVLPHLSERFSKIERIFFGKEKINEKTEMERVRRVYELSFKNEPPNDFLFRIPYDYAAFVVQILGEDIRVNQTIKKMKATGILHRELSEKEHRLVRQRLERVEKWVERYATERHKLAVIEDEDLAPYARELYDLLEDPKEILKQMVENLQGTDWQIKQIQDTLKEIIENLRKKSKVETREKIANFLQGLYLGFTGGRKVASMPEFLSLLGKERVINRIERIIKVLDAFAYLQE